MNLVQLVISFVSVGENQFRIQKACNIIIKEHAFVVVSEISNYYSLYRVALNVSMDNAAMLC